MCLLCYKLSYFSYKYLNMYCYDQVSHNLVTASVSSVAHHIQLFAIPWTAAQQASLVNQLPELAQTHVYWVGDAIQPSHPLLSLPCLQSFPASGSFPMSMFFTKRGQSIGVSASTWILPMNIQDWFPLGLAGLISLQSRRLKSLLQNHSSKASILQHLAFFIVQLTFIHDHWKNHSLDQMDLCWQSNVSAF